jgi:protein ImuB
LGRCSWCESTNGAARQAGALAVACRVDCEGAPATGFEFGLFQPTASARQLLELADLQLERLRLAGPAMGIEMRVLRHAPLEERQGVLFEESRTLGQSRPLAALVNRLAGRLGRDAVVRCRLMSDAQPERAFRAEPLVGRTRRIRKSKPREASPSQGISTGALDRPLTLLAQPVPLEAMSVAPEGPPISFRRGRERHTVARHWGPERIETGWWRRERALRDYYRVETTEGRRFWLFRRRQDGAWFLHACF